MQHEAERMGHPMRFELTRESNLLTITLPEAPFCKSYIRGSLNKFPDFFVWALLLIVHT